MKHDAPLGWDPAKKAARDKVRDVNIARQRVGDVYRDWQYELCKRARSRREIIQALSKLKLKLKELWDKAGEHAEAIWPWERTIEMIDGKIGILTAVQICADNTAIQHVPATMQLRTDGTVTTPKTQKFRNIKEFNAIDFVQHFSEQPGFRGFYTKMSMEKMDIRYFIIAQYENDAAIACELFNDVCLDDFPSYDDITGDTGDTFQIGPDILTIVDSGKLAETPAANPADASLGNGATEAGTTPPATDTSPPSGNGSGANGGQPGNAS